MRVDLRALAMRVSRLRFTVRRMMVIVAVTAILLVAGTAFWKCLGPRNGSYHGSYRYLGEDWRWHEVRGSVIFVREGMILVD